MFEAHFLLLLIMFIKNIAKFNYLLLVNDEASITHCKIMRIIHKINSNKIFEINEVINRALRQFA